MPALTSLRGIAAVTVLLYHSSFIAFNFAGGAPPWLWRRGSLAVDLFFFLSGFVLTHVYRRRLGEDRNWRTISRILWVRFCRIYPTSLFTTIVFLLAFTIGNLPFPASASFTSQLIAPLLLMQVAVVARCRGQSSVLVHFGGVVRLPAIPLCAPDDLPATRPHCLCIFVLLLIEIAVVPHDFQRHGSWPRAGARWSVHCQSSRPASSPTDTTANGYTGTSWEKDAILIGNRRQ